jgi:hypothetical protein
MLLLRIVTSAALGRRGRTGCWARLLCFKAFSCSHMPSAATTDAISSCKGFISPIKDSIALYKDFIVSCKDTVVHSEDVIVSCKDIIVTIKDSVETIKGSIVIFTMKPLCFTMTSTQLAIEYLQLTMPSSHTSIMSLSNAMKPSQAAMLLTVFTMLSIFAAMKPIH